MCRVDSLLNCRLFSDVAHGLRESELRNSFLAQPHLVFAGSRMRLANVAVMGSSSPIAAICHVQSCDFG